MFVSILLAPSSKRKSPPPGLCQEAVILQLIQIRRHGKIPDLFLFSQIQRVVRMPLLGTLPRAKPPGAVFLPDGDHVPDTVPEIGAFFYDGAPGRPNRRGKTRPHLGEDIPKRRHILPVEGLVALGIHVLRSGGSLGIDIEHQKLSCSRCPPRSVPPISAYCPGPRHRGGGVDPDTDQGILPGSPAGTGTPRSDREYTTTTLPVKIPLGRGPGPAQGQKSPVPLFGRGICISRPPLFLFFSACFLYLTTKAPLCRGFASPPPLCICSSGKL